MTKSPLSFSVQTPVLHDRTRRAAMFVRRIRRHVFCKMGEHIEMWTLSSWDWVTIFLERQLICCTRNQLPTREVSKESNWNSWSSIVCLRTTKKWRTKPNVCADILGGWKKIGFACATLVASSMHICTMRCELVEKSADFLSPAWPWIIVRISAFSSNPCLRH